MALKHMMDLLDGAKHKGGLPDNDSERYTQARELFLPLRRRTADAMAQQDKYAGVTEARVDPI
eukprot:12911321-Prorocentrum_lima.AAC.1